ncbi:MAG: MBL fold metallo-hydrolase, partial [Planctomycetota bacterium]
MTGSRYLVEAAGSKLLVDCGLYQERQLRGRNWDPFPVPPESVDAVLLTHAHLDHVGYLPRLGCKGFAGPIHATPATAEIAKIVLLDSGHIQEEDARKKRRRHKKESRRGPYPVQPLYTEEDAERCVRHFSPVKYRTPLELAEGKITATWHDAGHILGSAMLTLDVRENGDTRRILFSGDVGRWDKPILRDPTMFEQADYVVVESTYANRKHKEDTVEDVVAEEVNRAFKSGGNLVIPSFSVERAHEVMYVLNELLLAERIPQLMVFIDSPMAIRVTEVFKHHPELFDAETMGFIREGSSPFEFPGLTMTRTVDESKSINDVRGTRIIIAGSGMCTGG